MAGKTLERIKMIIIVVLFMSTILLLYLLWSPGGVDIAGLIPGGDRNVSIPETRSLIRAQLAVLSRGSGGFECSADTDGDVQDAVWEELGGFLSQSYVENSAISPEQYSQALSEWPSVRVLYDAEIPFSAFCTICSPESTLSIREDVMMRSVAFSEAAADSVFVEDASGNVVRFVFGEARDSVEKLLSQFGDDTYPCFSSHELLGYGDSILTLGGETSMQQLSASVEADDSDFGVDAAKNIFGDSFSFVRRMTDSFGNITYMYGYGDRNLYLYTDGSIAFSTSDEGALQTGFLEDLETALRFAARCGRLGDQWSGMRLCGYSDSGPRGGARARTRVFEFAQTAGERAVYGEGGPALRVSVTGGSVTSLYRAGLSISYAESAVSRQVLSPANVIAGNSHHIYNVLHGSVLAAESDEAFAYAAGETGSLIIGYFSSPGTSSGSRDLLPCWVLTTSGGVRFYFDLFSGTPLGYTR